MPRKLYPEIQKTFKFSPKFKRDSYIEYQKSRMILKVIEANMHNYKQEMYQVFDNLMELNTEELTECLNVPKRVTKFRKK